MPRPKTTTPAAGHNSLDRDRDHQQHERLPMSRNPSTTQKTYLDVMPPDFIFLDEMSKPTLLISLAEWVEIRAEKHHANNCFEAAEALDSVANGLRILAEEAR